MVMVALGCMEDKHWAGGFGAGRLCGSCFTPSSPSVGACWALSPLGRGEPRGWVGLRCPGHTLVPTCWFGAAR